MVVCLIKEAHSENRSSWTTWKKLQVRVSPRGYSCSTIARHSYWMRSAWYVRTTSEVAYAVTSSHDIGLWETHHFKQFCNQIFIHLHATIILLVSFVLLLEQKVSRGQWTAIWTKSWFLQLGKKIAEETGLNLGWESGYPNGKRSWWSSVPPGEFWVRNSKHVITKSSLGLIIYLPLNITPNFIRWSSVVIRIKKLKSNT
jgi:hypothetical protein